MSDSKQEEYKGWGWGWARAVARGVGRFAGKLVLTRDALLRKPGTKAPSPAGEDAGGISSKAAEPKVRPPESTRSEEAPGKQDNSGPPGSPTTAKARKLDTTAALKARLAKPKRKTAKKSTASGANRAAKPKAPRTGKKTSSANNKRQPGRKAALESPPDPEPSA